MKKNKVFKILNGVFSLLFLVCLSFLSYSLLKVKILPVKYLIFGYGFIGIFFLIVLFCLFLWKNKIATMVSYVLLTIVSFIFLIATLYLNETYKFIVNATKKTGDTLSYSVVVLKDREERKLKDLENKRIGYVNEEHISLMKEELNFAYQEVLRDSLGEVMTDLLKEEVDAICLEDALLSVANETESFKANTKVIYTFQKLVKNGNLEKEESIPDNFILYISGIDQYGSISTRGRSDVNILAVVNRFTNHILLVNTPRDYYVQLSGTTGLKDKLTHAGIYGIKKSMDTLEDLYGIQIDHYLRVNFNTLIKVIDEIGGIDIYSDTAFIPHTDSSFQVKKGWNHLNGKEALAYSRERYAYVTGDNHRGENQEQVITAIIEKITTSSVLVSQYNSILNALDGAFQTDMSMEEITEIIRYQLDKMPTWKIDSTAVVGFDHMDYTYSMGNDYLLYVMLPDSESMEKAKKKITEVWEERENEKK